MNAKVRSLVVTLVLVLLLVGGVKHNAPAMTLAAPPPLDPSPPTMAFQLIDLDGMRRPLDADELFPDRILHIRNQWERHNLIDDALTFTTVITYPSPQAEFYEDAELQMAWDTTYINACTHDPVAHTIECTGAFPPSDPREWLTTYVDFYIEGTCSLYPDPPNDVTLSGNVTYSDGATRDASSDVTVAPRIDLTTLANAPADGSKDVVIETAAGDGPLLQWRDYAGSLVCGAHDAINPVEQDVTYGVYLHKPGQPLERIGDQNGECSRQVQLLPSQLSCDENGNPQTWEWVVSALDIKYSSCSPTPRQETAFRFTTASCRPAVDEVRIQYGDKYFLQNVGVENKFDVRIDWNGPAYQPPPDEPIDGAVYFEINGERTPPDGVPGDLQGARTTFNMGQDFKAGWDGGANVVKIWAEYRPETGDPLYRTEIANVTPLVYPFPAWAASVQLGDFGVDLGEGVVEYANEAKYPDPAFEASVDVPKAVPYLGGKQLGILESQAVASVEASSAGEGKLGLDGETGLGLGAVNLVGELGGEGQFKFKQGEGLYMDKATFKLGISTPFEQEMSLADLVPAVKAAEEWWLVGELTKKVTRSIIVKGSITPKIGIEADFVQQGRTEWVFEGSIARGELELKVVATFKPYEKTSVEVYGGGTPFLEFNLPAAPDYFRRMGIDLVFGTKLQAWRWEQTFEYNVTCELPGGCKSDDDESRMALMAGDSGWTLMGREYVTADYNTFTGHTATLHAAQTVAAGPTSATPLIANVYPLTEPALAIRADGAAPGARTLAYVTDDPAKPVGQGEELVVMQWDGASQTWTPPLTLTDDLRLDFAPQTAYDGAGNAVVVWERTYTDVVTSGLNLTFTQQLDIAAITWISDTAAWSEITMLTENDGLLDHSPRLRAGADGSLLALWLTCDGTDIMGAPGHPLTYTYATWDSAAQTWSAPQPAIGGLTGVIEMDVAVYSATQAALVYAVDTDGVITTTADAELYYSRYDGAAWSAPVRLTHDVTDDVADTTPTLVYDDAGRLTLLWLRGGDLMMLRENSRDDSLDVADAQLVRADSGAGGFHALSLSRSPEGHLALVWQGLQGDRVDLAYSVYDADAGRWGADQHLMADDALETALAPAFDADGVLHLAYRKTATEYVTRTVTLSSGETFTVTNVPQPGRSDLYVLTHTIGRDLTVSDLTMTPPDPAAGETVTLTVQVHNAGDLETGPVVVRFDAGATAILTVTAAPTLTAGTSISVSVPWNAPTTLTAPVTLRAVVDPADAITETFEDNNTAETTVFRSHLVADYAVRAIAPEAVTYTLGFHNAGSLPAAPPITVTLRADDPAGTVLGAALITDAIAAGEAASATLVITDTGVLAGRVDGWMAAGDPAPDRANAWPIALTLGPDLAVPGFGEAATVYVHVENRGTLTATGAALTVWRDVDAASLGYTDTLVHDGDVVYSATLPALAPGAAITVDLGLAPDAAVELWALADPHNVVDEIDETNNLAIRGAPSAASCIPPTSVAISGPTRGYTDTAYSFSAAVIPTDATSPLAFVWTPPPRPGSVMLPEGTVVTYTWDAPGHYPITVTVSGCDAVVSATHAIEIEAPAPFSVYLPLLLRNYESLTLPTNTRYVKRYGSESGDCLTPATACATIQYAVDVAEAGDLIAIAGYEAAYAFPGDPDGNPRWTYWATESRPKPSGYYGADNVMQVVLIETSLTLRGGYNADFTAHAPQTYKTVIRPGLDGGAGRGVLIAPFAEVTLEDLHILEGSAAGQGGRRYGSTTYDVGGGVYALGAPTTLDAPLVIRNCTIAGNVAARVGEAGYGGGVYLDGRANAVLEGNVIYGNRAGERHTQLTSEGGGVYARYSNGVRLTDNHIYDNIAATEGYHAYGGGVALYELRHPTVQGNRISGNVATRAGQNGYGGGLNLWRITGGIVSGNVISGNVAGGSAVGAGGGVSLYSSNDIALRQNLIYANVAAYAATLETSGGGGVRIANGCTDITLENNVIAQNLAPYGGSGVLIALDAGYAANVTLRHNTIADNGVTNERVSASADERMSEWANQRMGESAPDGREAVTLRFLAQQDVPQEAQGIMTVNDVTLNAVNNIIAGHTRGVFELFSGNGTLVFDHTLWHGNATDADPTVARTNDVVGDPAFVDAPGGDYHIGAGSAARDAGASAGVSSDLDGAPRDAQPDIGAYEWR